MTSQLALVEVRRLLRNPYLWTVAIGTPALLVLIQRNQLPNLAEVTVTAAMATFLVAATLLVVANLATLRDQREGVPETLAALPGQAEVRTRAVLLATGCLGAVLVAAVIGAVLLIRPTQGLAGGYVDLLEAFAAALAAGVMAAAGVALGRWLPSPIAAPAVLGVLAIGFVMCLRLFVSVKERGPLLELAWYLPITVPYEIQVFGRPAWPRLPYLAAALVLLAALAMLRHGRRPLRLVIVATALAVVVPAGIWVAVAAPSALAGLADQDDLGDREFRSLDSYLGPIAYGERELGYAQRLLDRADARELIWEHWDVLLDPQTTIEAALPQLGLTDQLPSEPLTSQPCQ